MIDGRRQGGPILVLALLVLAITTLVLPPGAEGQKHDREGHVPVRAVPGPPGSLPGPGVTAAVASPSEPDRVYGATHSGLFVSVDRGATWHRLTVDGDREEVFGLAVHPTDSGVVYLGRRDGLWQVRDQGRGRTQLALPISELYIPLSIAVAPSQPDVIYVATARQGIFRSDDGGASWTAGSHGLPKARAGGRPEEIHTLVVDPRNAGTAYIADQRSGVYRTTDGGTSWDPFNRGLPSFALRGVYPPRLAFDPGDPPRLYLLVLERVHSHLLRNRLYVAGAAGTWLPVEAELPAGTRILGMSIDRGTRALRLWAENGIWEVLLPGDSGAGR